MLKKIKNCKEKIVIRNVNKIINILIEVKKEVVAKLRLNTQEIIVFGKRYRQQSRKIIQKLILNKLKIQLLNRMIVLKYSHFTANNLTVLPPTPVPSHIASQTYPKTIPFFNNNSSNRR